MNAVPQYFLPDVQSSADLRQITIDQVGIKGLRYPLSLATANGVQNTVASFDMDVALPPSVKGTHMSRFVELLEDQNRPLNQADILDMLGSMLLRLEAEAGRIVMSFPYFIRKSAPVSGVSSLIDVEAEILAEVTAEQAPAITIKVKVPVTSLCPCSKKISAYGAHNQRSIISISAKLQDSMQIEELVRMAEEEASCEVFGLLKRPDEKWVTERAYENPKFVEDLVRDIALRLKVDARIHSWVVESENFESIHNHSAYALIRGTN